MARRVRTHGDLHCFRCLFLGSIFLFHGCVGAFTLVYRVCSPAVGFRAGWSWSVSGSFKTPRERPGVHSGVT